MTAVSKVGTGAGFTERETAFVKELARSILEAACSTPNLLTGMFGSLASRTIGGARGSLMGTLASLVVAGAMSDGAFAMSTDMMHPGKQGTMVDRIQNAERGVQALHEEVGAAAEHLGIATGKKPPVPIKLSTGLNADDIVANREALAAAEQQIQQTETAAQTEADKVKALRRRSPEVDSKIKQLAQEANITKRIHDNSQTEANKSAMDDADRRFKITSAILNENPTMPTEELSEVDTQVQKIIDAEKEAARLTENAQGRWFFSGRKVREEMSEAAKQHQKINTVLAQYKLTSQAI